MNKYNEIRSIIDNNDTISFDIFDTLLFRNIYKPSYIFNILSDYVLNTYGFSDFYNLRIQCESESRLSCKSGESNIDDIYNCISAKADLNCEDIKLKELEIEYKFITVNPFMKKVFDYAIEKNKEIVLISDMYLKKDFIVSLLNKCGYSNYKLFISNEYFANKGTGELFECACKELNLNKSTWLHIGDNYASDYQKPIDIGINAYHYKNVSTYRVINDPETIAESIAVGIINNNLYNGLEKSYWEVFGIRYVSLIYFGFAFWLYNLTQNEDNVFFMARDGYAIKKIYDKICKINNNNIFTQYSYCSRQSVQIPSLTNGENITLAIKFLCEGNRLRCNKITLKEFLEVFGLEWSDNFTKIINTFGFISCNDVIEDDNFYQARNLILKLSSQVSKHYANSKELAVRYLNQLGFNKFKKINIMDIGWAGSIQQAIGNLMNKDITGYYFGTRREISTKYFGKMFGWMFDRNDPELLSKEILENVMMMEFIFSAPHGSTLGYEEREGKIVPILNENYISKDLIICFQNSAIDICDEILQYWDYIDVLKPSFCIKEYYSFLKNKKDEDLEMFSSIYNDWVIGSNDLDPYVIKLSRNDLNLLPSEISFKSKKSFWYETFWFDSDININERTAIKYKLISDTSSYVKMDLTCFKLYIDTGDSFNEKETMLIKTEKSGDYYSFKLDMPLQAKTIRIDPVEYKRIIISDIVIKVNGDEISPFVPNSSISRNKSIVPKTTDPQIIFKIPDNYLYSLEFKAKILIR